MPTVSSAPTTSCRRPVALSTGSRSRPSAPPSTSRHGGAASGRARSASSAHGRHEAQQRAHVEPAGARASQPDRQGALARRGVADDVAQVVGLEERHRQEPDGDGGDEGDGGEMQAAALLDEGGAGGRHQSEEHEDERLPQSDVAVGAGASGVEPPRGDARDAHGEEPPGGEGGQGEPGDPGDPERGEGGGAHGGRLGQARGDQAQRTDPDLVGAPDAVGVVVGVVRADLQGEGDEEGQDGAAPQQARRVPVELLLAPPADGRAHDHRHHRRGQGAGAGAQHPPADRPRWPRCGDAPVGLARHGRRGNREKSGGRCSTKALRPSWPSSVM